LASRFFARVSVCDGFDWLCFVASALSLLALQGFQNRAVFSWQRFWQKYKLPFFSRRFGQRKISSLPQSLLFGALIGRKSVFQQAFWLA
jgi:hypothetical protein